VCAFPPPDPPAWTDEDTYARDPDAINRGFLKMVKYIEIAIWNVYCRCIAAPPGGADPLPPPLAPLPPGSPWVDPSPRPVLVCSNDDICSALQQIERHLDTLSYQVGYVRFISLLTQRQGVPFGYSAGSVHSALSGSGHFTIGGILGLAVTFDSLPSEYLPSFGDPNTFHQLGKITLGTADGWVRSWQPTHSPYLILPIPGAMTLVGWSFSEGIVATITELNRLP